MTFLLSDFANIFHLRYASLLQCSKYQHFRTDCFNICTSPGFPPRIFKWCLPVLNKVLTCTLHFKLCPEQPSSWYNTSWIPRGHCSIRLDCNYHVNILCSDMQICTHANCIIPSSPWNVDLCSTFWEFLMKQDIKLSLTQENLNYLTLARKVVLLCSIILSSVLSDSNRAVHCILNSDWQNGNGLHLVYIIVLLSLCLLSICKRVF